jgi:hypothetical protein
MVSHEIYLKYTLNNNSMNVLLISFEDSLPTWAWIIVECLNGFDQSSEIYIRAAKRPERRAPEPKLVGRKVPRGQWTSCRESWANTLRAIKMA